MSSGLISVARMSSRHREASPPMISSAAIQRRMYWIKVLGTLAFTA